MSAPLRIDRQGALIGLDWDLEKSEKSRMDAAEKDVTNRIRDVGHATAVEVANGRRARQMLQDDRPTSVQLSSSVCLSLLLLRFPKFHSFLFQVLDGRRMDPRQNERGRS